MPWTLCIRRRDGSKLGALGKVQQLLSERIPGVRFWREPSTAEKAKYLPEEHRRMLVELVGYLPADARGLYESDEMSFELFFGSDDVVDTLTVDIRGDGNPIVVLREIVRGTDWQVEDPSGDPIDLALDTLPGWEAFAEYRDAAVDAIRKQVDGE